MDSTGSERTPAPPDGLVCYHYRVTGRVQGVGFRYFTLKTAQRLGLHGWVRNDEDGTVELVARGTAHALAALEAALAKGPPAAAVDSVTRLPWTGDLPAEFVLGR